LQKRNFLWIRSRTCTYTILQTIRALASIKICTLQTNKTTKGARISFEILEIIHTDICGPFSTLCLIGQRYFISFIDDHTRYMYLYFLTDKVEALNAYKTYKVEVEKQKEKKIKIVRSDRGGEYYGRYTEEGQMIGPFAKFLQE
jgi:hypothetical protein